MHPCISLSILLISCLLLPLQTSAFSLPEQLPADPFVAGTFFSDVHHPREAATPFALDEDASITSIVWWGGYSGLPVSSSDELAQFSVRIYAADSWGGPKDTAFYQVQAAATRTSVLGAVIPSFQFEMILPKALHLPAGVPMWLALVDLEPKLPTFGWRKSSEFGRSFSRIGTGHAWQKVSGEASFRLKGTAVPEPGTALLVGAGLAGIAATGRRVRRRE